MNICFYTDTFFPWVGGAEMVLDNLARELTGLGHSIVVLAPRAHDANDEQYPYEVVRYRKPFSKRIGLRLMVPKLVMLHRKHRFDIIHCHSSYPPAYVALAFRQICKVSVVVRPHGRDVLPGARNRNHPRVSKRLFRTLQNVDGIIAQGSFLKQTILDFGVREDHIHIIHNGVRLSEFAPGDAFDHPRPYILGLGNLKLLKGFDVLLNAYALLGKDAPDLLIAGTGREEDSLRSLCSELGLNERVRFVAHVEGRVKVDLYRSSLFFICPSRIETFGNVILEAFACGRAVIATAIGGNTELVKDGERGLLCESENPEALAKTIQSMLDSPEQVRHMAEAASSYIATFDWPLTAQRYLALYEQLMEKR